jgi:hypothetical protein
MKHPLDLLRDGFRFVTNDTTTAAILVAVITVCFFAFALGAELELVCGLLALGIVTAVVEARMHARARDE